MVTYDMCVDYDELCTVEDKLKKIEYDLSNSTEQMVKAIQVSQEFLAGMQFEKAKRTTAACVEVTQKTESNIRNAIEYIAKLKTALEDYSNCSYDGGHHENIRFNSIKK